MLQILHLYYGKSGIGKMENDFEKAAAARKNRAVIYVFLSLDSMKRLYSESKASRMYDRIKKILFRYLCLETGGEISVYGDENFASLNYLHSYKSPIKTSCGPLPVVTKSVPLEVRPDATPDTSLLPFFTAMCWPISGNLF